MILRIYWTDRYQRQAIGFNRCTPGIRERMAKQFDVSVEVIKKLVGIRHNQHAQPRRRRFRTISLKSIQRHVKERLRRDGLPVQTYTRGRPPRRKENHADSQG